MKTAHLHVFLIPLLAGLASEVYAADLTKIDRSISKEPAYKTQAPKYCLLVFGPEARSRIWLVLDGETLYVDRKGNGDLTGPGKSTKPLATDSDIVTFQPITFFGPDGKSEEKLNFTMFGWRDYRAGKNTPQVNPYVEVSWRGRTFGAWGDESGPAVWGAKPQEAPVLHIDGPLQMGFETAAKYALEAKG